MPGRFAQIFTWQTLYASYQLCGVPPAEAFRPRYNIAPMQQALVIWLNPETGARESKYLRWGLMSMKTNPDGINAGLINARQDSVARLVSFRDAFKTRRCIVCVTGVYEWKLINGKKQPYFVHRDDDFPLSFAGLWEHWAPPGHEPQTTFAIITTEPNELITPLHHRMGAALNPDEFDTWLDPKTPAPTLQALLVSRPWDGVHYRPVNPIVNSVKNELPACNEPWPEPQESEDGEK